MSIAKGDVEYAISVTGSIESAGKKLGVSRSYIYRMAKKYGLTKKERRIEIDSDLLIKEWNAGKTVEQLAVDFYVCENTIRRRLDELGLKKYESKKEIIRSQVIKMLKNGMTNAEIADMYDCSIDRIRLFIKNQNLKSYRKKKKNVTYDVNERIEELSAGGMSVVHCKAQKISKTKQTCLYGGHCGGYDCCDYLMMTGKRRKYDPENPEICKCYVKVSEAEKKKIEAAKTKQGRDILIT